MLTAPERERLRREVDRKRRERIGARVSLDNAWCSIPEAASVVGVKATTLRQLVRDLGIERKQKSSTMMIRVRDLDRLRG